jgi:hypothetical protein
MLSAAVFLIVRVVANQADTVGAEFSTSHFYYASRLIGALLIATVVPLLIDRHARRSNRVRQ